MTLITAEAGYASDEVLQQKVIKLETKIEELQRKTTRKDKSLRDDITKIEQRVKINGFLTAGLSTSDSEAATIFNEISNDRVSTQADSILGLQFALKINEKADATVQLVSKGISDYEANTEWAYLSYKINDDLTARAGRFKIPFYMLSNSIDVKFVYPWVRLPVEVYSLTVSDAEMFDLIYRYNLGHYNFKVQLLAGTSTDQQQISTEKLAVDSQISPGLVVEITRGNWLTRLGYLRGTVNISSPGFDTLDTQFANLGIDPLGADKSTTTYANIGVIYNNGIYQVLSEAYDLSFEDTLAPASRGGYIALARRFGDWSPFISLATLKTINDSDRDDALQIINQELPSLAPIAESLFNVLKTTQDSVSLGVRWDFSPGIALKAQVDRAGNFDNTPGTFAVLNDDQGLPTPLTDKQVYVYSITLDSVF